MSYSVVLPVDYGTLPEALVEPLKRHLRISFADDDDQVRSYAAQAVSYAEKVWGFRVFGTEITWMPEPAGAARYQTPAHPISDFVVTAGGLDVSEEYVLELTTMTSPWYLARINGEAFPSDAVVTLTTGYADPEMMDPAMLGVILRVAAGLYENREPTGAVGGFVPGWINDMLTGLWVPRL